MKALFKRILIGIVVGKVMSKLVGRGSAAQRA